ncbi:MAG: hypothetical protein JW804_00255 [Sedimentisphaerales bacterium]|nr:hypothetical protein [Sedimentisphaerales bacterium]
MFRKTLILTVILLTMVCNLQAAQINSSWVGGYGDWGVASNWNPAVVPDNSTDTYVVTIDGSSETAYVQIYDSFTMDSLASYGNVEIKNSEIYPGLTVLNGLTNYGELLLCVQIGGDVHNTSGSYLKMEEHTNIYGDLINDPDATIEFRLIDIDVEGDGDGGKITNNGLIKCFSDGGPGEVATFENNGQIQLYYGSANSEIFDNNTPGKIIGWGHLTGDQLYNDGVIEASAGHLLLGFSSVTNTGSMKVNSGADMFVMYVGFSTSDVNNQGEIEINAGGSLVCDANLANQPNSVTMLKGGTLTAIKISQKAGAIFEGQGDISGNLDIEPNGLIRLTGPVNIFGDVQIDPNATLEISDGTTLIKGHCTCDNGTIHLIGGWLIPQGGLTNNNCNIIWEPGLYNNIADFNLDGKVDMQDFASFAETWLWQASWY